MTAIGSATFIGEVPPARLGDRYSYASVVRNGTEPWREAGGFTLHVLGLNASADEFGSGTWIVGAGVAFAYDSAGNRLDKGGTYGTGDRIMRFDGCGYDTDFDGNVTQRTCGAQTVTFTWSAEARLAALLAVLAPACLHGSKRRLYAIADAQALAPRSLPESVAEMAAAVAKLLEG